LKEVSDNGEINFVVTSDPPGYGDADLPCPMCGILNSSIAKYCYLCGSEISLTLIQRIKKIIKTHSWLIGIAGIILIAVLIFVGSLTERNLEVATVTTNTFTSIKTPIASTKYSTAEKTATVTKTRIPTRTVVRISPTQRKATYTPTDTLCSSAPPSRLKLNEDTKICTKSDCVYLRSEPSKGGARIVCMETGSVLWVLEGPICSNSVNWWQVRTAYGKVGWMMEGGDEEDPYYLCPN